MYEEAVQESLFGHDSWWENVPGAFSSNKGDDFRAVLEETIRVAEPDAPDVPLPEKGKWPLADAWYGDGWSIAYRVLDAQFWGVPQRRRRIALVADFGGHAAPEILFVRQGVCWDSAEGGTQEEETAAGAGSGAGKASAYRIGAYYSAGMLSKNPEAGIIPVDKSNTLDCNGGAPTSQQGGVCIVQKEQPIICLNDQGGNVMGTSVDVAATLRAQEHGHQPVIVDSAIPINTMVATRHKQLGRGTGFGVGEPGDKAFTISTNH